MTKEEAQKLVSEGIGYRVGSQLKADENLDLNIILKGIQSVFEGSAEEPDKEKFQQAAMLLQKNAADQARGAGEDFLSENSTEEGVEITDSGLQYRVAELGQGESPSESDKVTVHYEGRLVNGTIFDSSIKRGQPAQFGVNQVIPGWVEGLQLMKPGAKYTFFIPQELAYGESGSGRDIPPFSALIFEVELISVDK